jgi:hypothetical protein
MRTFISILIISFICLLSQLTFAQKKYTIEYSKKSDSFTYYQENDHKGRRERKAISFFKPQPTDQVRLIVKDYNGFMMSPKVNYQSVTPSSEIPTTLNWLSTLGGAMLGVDLSFLSSIQSLPLSRGEKEWSPEEKELAENLEILETQAALIQEKWELQKNLYVSLYDPQKSTSEIKKTAGEIFTKWRENPEIDWKSIESASQTLRKTPSPNIRKSLIDQINTTRDAENQMNELKSGAMMNAQDLEKLEYMMKQIPEEFAHNIPLQELEVNSAGGLKQLAFQIEFTENNLLADLEKPILPLVQYPKSDKIVYYRSNTWRTPSGEITHQLCNQCESVIEAEGFFNYNNSAHALPPIEYQSLFKNHPGAYGDWKIYDEQGNLSHHLTLQSFSNPNPPAPVSEKIMYRKSNQISIQQKSQFTIGTGIFMNHTFEDRISYRKFEKANGDSILIGADDHNEWVPSLGAQLRYLIPSQRSFQCGLTAGASINAFSNVDQKKVNLHLGTELAHSSLPYFSLTMGLSGCRTSGLGKNYTVGKWYTAKDLYFSDIQYDNNTLDHLTREVFKWGYYVGINLNF